MTHTLSSLLVVLTCVLASALHAGDSGDAPKIAVLRLTDAINASKSFQIHLDVFKQERATIETKIKEFDDTIQKLSTSIEALPAGNERLGQIQMDLDSTKAKREAYVRWWSKELDRRRMVVFKEQYALAVEALAEFCKQRGIKIVVQAADKEISAPDPVLMNLRIQMQTALYWNEEQDITDAFIGFANQRWSEKSAATPAPTPAPTTVPAGTP